MSRPVNQHWVPQFYLREFATPESREAKEAQVWIFSKNETDGPEQITNIRNICAKRYLYSPIGNSGIGNSGERDWAVDTRLNDLETLLAQIWKQVAWDFINLADDAVRKALALFVSTTHIRHPSNQEIVKLIHARLVGEFEKVPKKADGTPNIDRFMHENKEYKLDTSAWESYKACSDDEHHRFFTQSILTETNYIADILLKKRWSVVVSDYEHFITSDKPLAIQHQSRQTFGIGTAGAIVSFPLSPTRILIMDDQHQEPCNQYYPLTKENIGAFNYGIWRAGARFMITGRAIPEVWNEMIQWGNDNGYA